MTNMRLVATAYKTAIDYSIEHKKHFDPGVLWKSIMDWYNYTDITDSEMLAAAALEFPTFEPMSFSILEMLVNYYFPRFSTWEETEIYFDY